MQDNGRRCLGRIVTREADDKADTDDRWRDVAGAADDETDKVAKWLMGNKA